MSERHFFISLKVRKKVIFQKKALEILVLSEKQNYIWLRKHCFNTFFFEKIKNALNSQQNKTY